MGTVYQSFTPFEGIPPAANYPQIDVVAGSNFPVASLRFDATTQESIYFVFRAVNYGSGNITIDIDWYADTASSGNCVWEAQISCITPDADSQDVETDALATLNYVQDTHLGTTGQRVHRASITLSNLDSIAAGDFCTLKIARDADGTNATDDMTGDAQLLMVTISYSDT